MRKTIAWDKIVFGITIYVFLSLNARDFHLPNPQLFRWVLPVVLAFLTFIKCGKKIPLPPMLIVFFIFAIAPSFLDTPNIKDSAMMAISFIWIVYGTYICFWGGKDRKEMEDFFKIICGLLILFEVLSIAYIAIGRGGGDRATGFLTNPNTLAIYSNLSFWASYYFFFKRKDWKKFIFGFLMVMSVVLVLMSGSRTGFIMILISTVIAVMLQAKTTLAKILTFLFVVVFMALLFSGNLKFLKISALDRLLADGGGSRGELWEFGLGVWKRFPIFGCGYRQSAIYNTLPGNELYDFHNSYLSLLCEVGVWGIIVILVAIVPTIYSAGKQVTKELKTDKNSCFLVASCMAFSLLVCAWSESFLFSVGATEAFAFWMIFTWIMNYLRKPEHNDLQRLQR